MSNSLLVNPIVIVSATSSFKASTLSALGAFQTLLIEKIYWENPSNVGDVVSIINPASSAVLLPLRCEVANQSQVIDWTPRPKLWADFEVAQIDSGTLYIFLA